MRLFLPLFQLCVSLGDVFSYYTLVLVGTFHNGLIITLVLLLNIMPIGNGMHFQYLALRLCPLQSIVVLQDTPQLAANIGSIEVLFAEISLSVKIQ